MKNITSQLFRTKVFLLIIVGLGVILVLAQFLFPVRQQKLAVLDEKIINDLYSIQSSIDTYVNDNGSLPNDLDDLDLDKELEKRAEANDYEYEKGRLLTYELCADFKTDASEGIVDDNPLSSFSYGASYTPPDSPYGHNKGKDCFEFTSYSYNSYSNPLYDYKQEPQNETDEYDYDYDYETDSSESL